MATPAEIARRITGLLEVDAELELGSLSARGRGHRQMIFQRYLAAYIMVDRFGVQVEHAAQLLHRDRGTVTKALKVFRFLEGYQGWRRALDTIADLSQRFLAYADERALAQAAIPAPVGRERRNDPLPQWVRDRYAVEMEARGDIEVGNEARAKAEADSIYLRHPAVKAITDDPTIKRLLGKLVVSVTLSPPDELLQCGAAILLVKPEERVGGGVTLRLLVKGDSPPQIKNLLDARAAISRALLREGYRLTGAAEHFAARDSDGWRYVPIHVAVMAPLQ